MGRARTGHVEWRGGQWKTQTRPTSSGEKPTWIALEADVPPEKRLREDQKDTARRLAVILLERFEADGYVPSERDLTVSEYFERWNKARSAKYPRQAKSDESAFRLWIADEIGTLPLRAVTRERLIELSHHLDTIAAKGVDFGEKRARNIFSVVAAMFRDAHTSKDRTLRLLETNPMADVPWPERGTSSALKQMLFPREFLALVTCPRVPFVRARLYAVALYTTTRSAEVRVFNCSHFDLEHGSVQILMSDDPTARKVTGATATKSTKGGKARLTTLERNLAPLVDTMVSELRGVGRLFPERPKNIPKGNQWRPATTEYIPGPDGEYGVCGTFKRDLRTALEWAGIPVRPQLFDDSDRRASLSIRFHDLRASGITWRHARRDNPAAILQECGHEDQATNEIYIRALRGLAPGELFPELPKRLLETSGSNSPDKHQRWIGPPVSTSFLVGAEGLEDPAKVHETQGKDVGSVENAPGETTKRDASRDPDEAVRVAIKSSVDAGRYDLAAKLLEVLKSAPPVAAVVDIAKRR